jgi:hypothetical protein
MMARLTSQELRDRARGFREMATAGEDPRLKASLLLVAEEFEAEAARLEGPTDQHGDLT